MAYSPNSDRILTTCRDKIARLWTGEGELIMELRGHQDLIWRGNWSPDGTRVITASFDKTAQVWITDPKDLVRRSRSRLKECRFKSSQFKPYEALIGKPRIKEIIDGK